MQRIKRLLLYLLIVFFITSLTRSLIEYGKNQQFYQDYKNEFEKEKKRNTELKTQLVKSQDINEFEKIVRDKLNLTKQNEYILVIPNPTPTVLTPTPTPVPNYQQWIDTFK